MVRTNQRISYRVNHDWFTPLLITNMVNQSLEGRSTMFGWYLWTINQPSILIMVINVILIMINLVELTINRWFGRLTSPAFPSPWPQTLLLDKIGVSPMPVKHCALSVGQQWYWWLRGNGYMMLYGCGAILTIQKGARWTSQQKLDWPFGGC